MTWSASFLRHQRMFRCCQNLVLATVAVHCLSAALLVRTVNAVVVTGVAATVAVTAAATATSAAASPA